ncbi:MAG: LptF/LptG family permease [Vampirovibrionales bacterium]|nr:LptF/LptG family permease [Vampirovibrionales bacterium]
MKPAMPEFAWGTLERYILRELLETFLLGLAVFSLVGFFSDALLDFFRLIQSLGLPFDVALTLLGLQMPKILALVLPASAFLAVLLVFNRLNSHFELIAVRSTGASLSRLLMAPMVLALGVAGFTYVLGDWVVPYCNQQAESLKYAMVEQGGLPFNQESFLFKDYDGEHRLERLVYVGKLSGRTLNDATILDLSRPDALQIIQAQSGRWYPDKWQFNEANAYTVPHGNTINKQLLVSNHLGQLTLKRLFNIVKAKTDALEDSNGLLKDKANAQRLIADSDTQPFWVLNEAIRQRTAAGLNVSKKTVIKLWERLTIPLATLAMLAMAVPLAIHAPRQGAERGFVFAIGALFTFYMARAISVALGQSKILTLGGLFNLEQSLALAAWLPVALITLAAAALLWRKSRVL